MNSTNLKKKYCKRSVLDREREREYLSIDRRRFSEAMMWSVEVGIQRRTEGHKDLVDDLLLAVVAVAPAAEEEELTSSAIDADESYTTKTDESFSLGFGYIYT